MPLGLRLRGFASRRKRTRHGSRRRTGFPCRGSEAGASERRAAADGGFPGLCCVSDGGREIPRGGRGRGAEGERGDRSGAQRPLSSCPFAPCLPCSVPQMLTARSLKNKTSSSKLRGMALESPLAARPPDAWKWTSFPRHKQDGARQPGPRGRIPAPVSPVRPTRREEGCSGWAVTAVPPSMCAHVCMCVYTCVCVRVMCTCSYFKLRDTCSWKSCCFFFFPIHHSSCYHLKI